MRILSSFMLQPQRGSESTPLPVWTQKMAESSLIIWKKQPSCRKNTKIDLDALHTHMHFNLQELIQTHNLEDIEVPFTRKDIDKVIKECHVTKPLGLMVLMDNF
jgi:hypothetical protein